MDNFQNIDKIVKPNVDRGILFDRFLTYRRRMARLAAVQALFLYDFNLKFGISFKNQTLFDGVNQSELSDERKVKKIGDFLCMETVAFYKNVFFSIADYGFNRKNKKIDEAFLAELVDTFLFSEKKTDEIILKYIKEGWTINKLDAVIRAILRVAISEIAVDAGTDKKVICSEYTNIASNFFGQKETGFVNGVLDSIVKNIIK